MMAVIPMITARMARMLSVPTRNERWRTRPRYSCLATSHSLPIARLPDLEPDPRPTVVRILSLSKGASFDKLRMRDQSCQQ